MLLPPLCLQVAAKRQHLVRRLSKAASHAGELVALAAARCDARTQVQGAALGMACLLYTAAWRDDTQPLCTVLPAGKQALSSVRHWL